MGALQESTGTISKFLNNNNNIIEHGLKKHHFISPSSAFISEGPTLSSFKNLHLRPRAPPTGKLRPCRPPGRFRRLGAPCARASPRQSVKPPNTNTATPRQPLPYSPPPSPGSQPPTSSPGPAPHPASGFFSSPPPGAEDTGSRSLLRLGKEIGVAAATSAGNTSPENLVN